MKTYYETQKIKGDDTHKLSINSIQSILRRADWRFLTANPFPVKALCFQDGLLSRAVELISESTINSSQSDFASGDCDLVVGVNPDTKILKQARLALKPGGCCYFEWEVQPFHGINHIKNKLEALGFELINLYLPRPSPLNSFTQFWIPLEQQTAIDFFIASRYNKPTQAIYKRVLNFLRYTICRLFSGMVRSYPFLLSSTINKYTVSSIAYKPSDIERNNQTSSLTQSICSEPELRTGDHFVSVLFNRFGNAESRTLLGAKSFLMITKGQNLLKKIIVVVFQEPGAQPSYVLKIPRVKESSYAIENEVKILKTMEQRLPMIRGVPRVIIHGTYLEYFISGETYMDGSPLDKILTKNNYRELALKVTSWLVELALHSKTKLPEDWRKRTVEYIFDDFSSIFGRVLNPDLIIRTKNMLATLELPYLVCEHRDFCLVNINIDARGQIGVIDWEGSVFCGLPGIDLIYFLFNLGFREGGPHKFNSFEECYSSMLDRNTFTGKTFHDCLEYYAEKVGIPQTSFRALCLITFLLYSCLESKVMLVNQGQLSSEELCNNKFFRLWKAELLS